MYSKSIKIQTGGETRIVDVMLTPKDVITITGLSRRTVYKLLASPCFPKIKIGGQYRVPLKAFEQWQEDYLGKEFIIE